MEIKCIPPWALVRSPDSILFGVNKDIFSIIDLIVHSRQHHVLGLMFSGVTTADRYVARCPSATFILVYSVAFDAQQNAFMVLKGFPDLSKFILMKDFPDGGNYRLASCLH